MVRQLEANKRPPLSLTVIDSGPKWRHRKRTLSEWIARENSIRRGLQKFGSVRIQNLLRPGKTIFEQIRYGFLGDPAQRREYWQRRVTRYCTNAFEKYRLQPTGVPIKLIRSSEFEASPSKNFHLDWRGLTRSEFSVEVLDAEHERILFPPSVVRIAELIRGGQTGE